MDELILQGNQDISNPVSGLEHNGFLDILTPLQTTRGNTESLRLWRLSTIEAEQYWFNTVPERRSYSNIFGWQPSSNNSVVGQLLTVQQATLSTVTISASDANAAETLTGQTANPGKFTLTRTGNIASSLKVNYTISGTATNGTDYQTLTNSITFAAGLSTAIINVTPSDDTVFEGNETVILNLATSANYTLGTAKTATVNIADNDKPTITLSATDASAAETLIGQTANPGRFTLTRTGNKTAPLTVSYSVAGTATNGTDYNTLTKTVTFAAGSATALINVNVKDDAVYEGNETAIVTLASGTSYILGTAKTATVTIVDNDKPTITISATDANAAETLIGQTANPGRFTLTRTGNKTAPLTVSYSVAGTATNGTDYNTLTKSVTFAAGSATALINVNVKDDAVYEGNETVIVTLANGTSYILGTAKAATVNLVDNDSSTNVKPTITISATDASAGETLTGQTVNPGRFMLTRTGNKTAPLTVSYSVAGTATNGTDYNTLTKSVTFAAGSATALINVNVKDDAVYEGNETAIVTLASGTSYILGTAKTATVTIVDNDSPTNVKPTITISATDASAGETLTGQTANPGRFTLTRTGSTASSLTINYTVAGTATNGVDYNALSGTATFSAASSTAIINLTPINDSLVEGDETVVVNLSSNTNYNLGTVKTATVKIVDNDSSTITVTSPNGGESLPGGQINITWTDNISENVNIDLYRGNTWIKTWMANTPSDGSQLLYTPIELETISDYRVKITSVANSNIYDWSDGYFSIVVPSYLYVTSPNGGESFQAGSSYNINWNDNISENVKIDLYKAGSLYSTLFSSTASDGSETWSVPSNLASGSDYQIKISSVSNGNVYDWGNNYFTVSPAPYDSAGNDLTQALSFGNLTYTQYKTDFVGDGDSNDFYSFNVNTPSNFNLILNGLSNDADVQLIQDRNGNGQVDEREILSLSTQGGTNQDSISRYLGIGKYFVRVYSYSGNTYYNLSLSATSLGNANYIDPSSVQSYFGTNVIRSFFNSFGVSTYQSQYGNLLMYGSIADYYNNNNFNNPDSKNGLFRNYSGLGLPTSSIYTQADGSQVMEFEGGTLTNRDGVVTPYYYQKNGDRFDLVGMGAPDGAELLWKNDYAYWNPGSVGQPISPVRRINGGWVQEFTGSPRGDGDSIFLLKDNQIVQGGFDGNNIPKGGPYRVQGYFLNIYRSVGGYEDIWGIGFPTMSQERANYNGYKLYQQFEYGFIAQTQDDRIVVQKNGRTIWTNANIEINQTINGSLSSTDVVDGLRPGYFTDDYRLTGVTSGQKVRVSLTSYGFTPQLQLLNASTGELMAQSYIINNGNNTVLEFTMPSGWNYMVRTTSYYSGQTGSYSLNVVPVTNTNPGIFNIGTLSGSSNYSGYLDGNSPIDYKFYLGSNSDFSLRLDDLSNDANVTLLKNQGSSGGYTNYTLLEQSNKSGTSAETITTNLEAGYYTVRIGGANTNYNLSLFSRVAGQQTNLSYSEFLGTVMNMSVALNIRSGPGTGYNDIGDLQSGTQLIFDGWTNGSLYKDITGQQQDQWFRIKGTNNWVAGAYIIGNPTQDTPYIDASSSSPTNPENLSGATNVDGTLYYNGQTVYNYGSTLIRTGATDIRAGVESTYADPRTYKGSVWTIIQPERGNEGKDHLVTITWGSRQWEGTIKLTKGGVAIHYEDDSSDPNNYATRTVTVRAIPNDLNAAQVITKETKIINEYGEKPFIDSPMFYLDIRRNDQRWRDNTGVPAFYTLFRDEDVDGRKNVENVDKLDASGDNPSELKNNQKIKELAEYLGGKAAANKTWEKDSPLGGGYLDKYHPLDGLFHTGFDISFTGKTEVKALVAGTVIDAPGKGVGAVAIHNEVMKKTFVYLHMSNITVQKGTQIVAGQTIGIVSDVGSPGSVHLHFEVQDDAELEALVKSQPKTDIPQSYKDSQGNTFYAFSTSIYRNTKSHVSARMDNPLNAFIEAKALGLILDQPPA